MTEPKTDPMLYSHPQPRTDNGNWLKVGPALTAFVEQLPDDTVVVSRNEYDKLVALVRDVANLPMKWESDTTYHLIHRAQALVPPQEPGR